MRGRPRTPGGDVRCHQPGTPNRRFGFGSGRFGWRRWVGWGGSLTGSMARFVGIGVVSGWGFDLCFPADWGSLTMARLRSLHRLGTVRLRRRLCLSGLGRSARGQHHDQHDGQGHQHDQPQHQALDGESIVMGMSWGRIRVHATFRLGVPGLIPTRFLGPQVRYSGRRWAYAGPCRRPAR